MMPAPQRVVRQRVELDVDRLALRTHSMSFDRSPGSPRNGLGSPIWQNMTLSYAGLEIGAAVLRVQRRARPGGQLAFRVVVGGGGRRRQDGAVAGATRSSRCWSCAFPGVALHGFQGLLRPRGSGRRPRVVQALALQILAIGPVAGGVRRRVSRCPVPGRCSASRASFWPWLTCWPGFT